MNRSDPTRQPTDAGPAASAKGAFVWMLVAGLGLTCLGASAASTLEEPMPATRRAADADDVLRRLHPPAGPSTTPATGPASATAPAAVPPARVAVAPDVPARLLREGTFVVDRVGRVRSGADGHALEFVFEAEGHLAGSQVDPPMLLVPNLNLMALEQAARADPDRRFRVTGRVTEYRGRNHIMLEKVVAMR